MDILIAEDEFVSRNLLQKMIQTIGYQAVVAENGLEAWELFQKNSVKMLITDWMMPKMDGLELCNKIRSADKKGYTYIIMLTAKDQKEDLVDVFQSGADDYIPKPFDQEELQARIKTGERIINLEEKYQKFQNILIESRNKFRTVFDALQEKVIALDQDFIINSFNHRCLKDLNADFNDIIGKPLFNNESGTNLFAFNPIIKTHLQKVYESGKLQVYMNESTDNHGEKKYELVNCLPVINDDGKVFQTIIVAKDVTEERRQTEKIKSLNQKLHATSEKIHVKNKELEQTLQELKNTQAQILQSEKMASIGQLAAGVAHEINNPTGFVSSNLKSLEDYLKDMNQLLQAYQNLTVKLNDSAENQQLPSSITTQINEIKKIETDIDIEFLQEDIHDLIKDCREGTERIKKIVLDLKDFAHPGEDKLQATDINQGIESTLNVVSNELKYKARVVKDYGKLPRIKCYPQQLNQVFMNILVNAAQAMEKQGEIRIQTRCEEDQVEIRISDNASGIRKENIAKIFDPFFTTKDVGKGTGLGMNIAYNIVKKHNGTIDVDSTVGKGTTFTIKLPIEQNM